MCSGFQMTFLGLIAVFSIYLQVPRTAAVYLPVYDRWARQRIVTAKDDNRFREYFPCQGRRYCEFAHFAITLDTCKT